MRPNKSFETDAAKSAAPLNSIVELTPSLEFANTAICRAA
jgi:hypothetical protein